MSPAVFLAKARALDADIQALDRRFIVARLNNAPEATRAKLIVQRNGLSQQWAAMWHTRKVSL